MVMAPAATTTTVQYAPLTFNSDLTDVKYTALETQPHHHGPRGSKDIIQEALKERVESINPDVCLAGEEDAFFVADMGYVYRQHMRWKKNLKRVKPHYAVKCNPDLEVLRLLAALGTGFDCASKAEIEQVLKLGVEPSRIIYAQPCKTKSYVRFAAEQGVKQMTFDNTDELYKTKALFPDAELYLRIMTDDSSSLCRLSTKFGASMDSTQALLALAKQLDLNVVGVSFHVGSGASDPQAFVKAVQDARVVFDQAAALGFDMQTLDVGGGFSGDSFEKMAYVLSTALDDYFPPHIRIIGEPGRYYVASAFTIACNVIARRQVKDTATQGTTYMLYLNDGVYGNFSSIMFDHQHPVPKILKSAAGYFGERHGGQLSSRRATEYSIWGPTCDGIDRITERTVFHEVLNVGDWLYFEEMGAYTMCSATRFNGFTDKHDVVYVSDEPGASALLDYP